MTGARAAATLTGGVALLERAIGYTLGQLGLVSTPLLARPTPCAQWDLRALLVHLDDSLAALCEALDLRRVGLDAAPLRSPATSSADPAAELVSALRDRACRLLGALASTHEVPVSVGGHPLPTSIVSSVGAIDVAVHGWDVARACGEGQPIPGELAEDMLEISPLLVSRADRPARFAPPVLVPSLASASDKLVAYLGRDPAR